MPFVFVFVLFPKVWLRVISPDLELGFIESINPMIIVAGLILFAPVVKRFNIYWILVVGMFIGGGSILLLAIPPQWTANDTVRFLEPKTLTSLLNLARISSFN